MSGEIRVGVVGAGGQTGTSIMRALAAADGVSPRGICRNEITAGPLRAEGHEVMVGSLLDAGARDGLIGDLDAVVNLAWASGYPGKRRKEDESMLRAITSVPGRRLLVHFSSVAVYSTCVDPARNTFDSPRPDDPYGRDKLLLERLAQRLAAEGSTDVVALRLGHVYGAGQWVSKAALKIVSEGRGLPFDGSLPSNAIHAHNVGAGVRAVVLGGRRSGVVNLLDSPASTWRDLFDWHTETLGLPALPALDERSSEAALRHHRRRAGMSLAARIASESALWLRSLPPSLAREAPSVKDAGIVALARLKAPRLEQRLQQAFAASPPTEDPAAAVPEPFLLSGQAPGPALDYEPGKGAAADEELRRWYTSTAGPDAIREWNELWPDESG